MNVSTISQLILEQLDDNPAAPASVAPGAAAPYSTPPEILGAINEAQLQASWLTLYLEKTANFSLGSNFSLDANGCFYLPRPALTDFIVPLRFTYNGARIRPGDLYEIEAENDAWQNTAGTPARYASLGFNFLAVTPQTTGTAQMTYAASPAQLIKDTDVPSLPEAYHQCLVDYGVYRVKLKEGAQGLQRGLGRLNTFLDDTQRLGEYIRERSIAARYDVLPVEMALWDRSRLIDNILKRYPASR